jgi:gamma-glutamyl:cysteine ligase YbdK (ATP-grasp superfamily)
MNELIQPETEKYPYSLFQVYGLELEYMIVDESSLDVMPVCDRVLSEIAGETVNEAYPDGENGIIAWSNELALHVLEFKTVNPVQSLREVAGVFQSHVKRASGLLNPYGAVLMPTAMHPWMDPDREFRIWPHGSREIYNRFDSIFGCKGHGWSNLQSVHINLPFADNDEFIKLHNAIRILIPVMNGLTASSPFAGGEFTGYSDYRMEVYRTNSAKIPSITGMVVPEPAKGIDDYKQTVLGTIYSDLLTHDPGRIISHEWVNARGCIPRFERGSIEIRTLDIQESPAADIACAELIIAAAEWIVAGNTEDRGKFNGISTERLYMILLDTIKYGESSVIRDNEFLSLFGISENCTVSEFWKFMAERLYAGLKIAPELENIFMYGNLSSRILTAAGKEPCRKKLSDVYRELCRCLKDGKQFIP